MLGCLCLIWMFAISKHLALVSLISSTLIQVLTEIQLGTMSVILFMLALTATRTSQAFVIRLVGSVHNQMITVMVAMGLLFVCAMFSMVTSIVSVWTVVSDGSFLASVFELI